MDSDAGFFQSIASLIDDFKSPNVSARMNSMRSLKTIANALGVERTREELLPYINECVEGNDDILCVLAGELGTFIEHVGGVEHIGILLQMLETLGSAEDITIREKVTESLNMLGAIIFRTGVTSPQHAEFYGLVGRMTRSDWPGSRSTGVTLLPQVITAYSMTGKIKAVKDILMSYVTLARDPEPVVRRSVAMTFKSVLNVLRPLGHPGDSSALIAEFLHPVFIAISQDSQDGIRLLAYEVGIALNNPKVSSDVISRLIDSSSWRVRYMGAYVLADLSMAMFPQAHTDIMLKLLSDSEAEIRATTISQLGRVQVLPQVVLNKCFKFITVDSSPHVRSSMVGLLGALMDNIAPQDLHEFASHILQMAMANISSSTENSGPLQTVNGNCGDLDTALILVHQLGNLVKIFFAGVVSKDTGTAKSHSSSPPSGDLGSLHSLMQNLSTDKRWRVREAFAKAIHQDLIEHFPKPQVESLLVPLVLPGLVTDRVFTVRKAAAQTCAALCGHLGVEWSRTTAFPILSEKLIQSPNYLFRVTAAQACGALLQVLPCGKSSTVTDALIQFLRRLIQDTIANVRLAAVTTMQQLIQAHRLEPARCTSLLAHLSSETEDDIKKLVQKLREGTL